MPFFSRSVPTESFAMLFPFVYRGASKTCLPT